MPHESCRGVSGKFLGRVGEVLGKAERIGCALQARNIMRDEIRYNVKGVEHYDQIDT